jgi:hypothetical protein
MNLEQAVALCRLLAEEIAVKTREEGEECEQLETNGLYPDLITVDLFSSHDSCAFCAFAVIPNENPMAKEPTFAVLQYEPDSGDSWVHVSETVCFFATAFQTEGR